MVPVSHAVPRRAVLGCTVLSCSAPCHAEPCSAEPCSGMPWLQDQRPPSQLRLAEGHPSAGGSVGGAMGDRGTFPGLGWARESPSADPSHPSSGSVCSVTLCAQGGGEGAGPCSPAGSRQSSLLGGGPAEGREREKGSACSQGPADRGSGWVGGQEGSAAGPSQGRGWALERPGRGQATSWVLVSPSPAAPGPVSEWQRQDVLVARGAW